VLFTPDQAVEAALATRGGTVILAEPSDSPTAGSPGDSAELLPLLLTRAADQPSALWVCDPAAVHTARTAGAGAFIDTSVGGAFDPQHRRRIPVRAHVASLRDGRFTLRGQWNRGMLIDMGPAAVLECGPVSMLVSERPVSNIDPELFRSQGIEPERRRIVVVKSANAFRADYTPIARRIMLVDTPGISSPNLRALPWRRLPRPIYPLDPM
jgi:microcystin degradation protein MlrC